MKRVSLDHIDHAVIADCGAFGRPLPDVGEALDDLAEPAKELVRKLADEDGTLAVAALQERYRAFFFASEAIRFALHELGESEYD